MFVFLRCPAMKKVAIIMGSDSDLDVMKPAMETLGRLAIPYEVRVLSAHRTPALAQQFACEARANGFGALICAAGKAAHLAGAMAANTTLPVIGVPVKASLEGTGRAALHGADAAGHPGGDGGDRRRDQRGAPSRPDPRGIGRGARGETGSGQGGDRGKGHREGQSHSKAVWRRRSK